MTPVFASTCPRDINIDIHCIFDFSFHAGAISSTMSVRTGSCVYPITLSLAPTHKKRDSRQASCDHFGHKGGSSYCVKNLRATKMIIQGVIDCGQSDRDFDMNSRSTVQNDGTPMPHLLAGDIGNNDVTCALLPVMRV